jgi:hypothetical protein
MVESSLVNMVASVRELREWGKHRTEVTEVTEGGMGVVGRKFFGEQRGFGARTT